MGHVSEVNIKGDSDRVSSPQELTISSDWEPHSRHIGSLGWFAEEQASAVFIAIFVTSFCISVMSILTPTAVPVPVGERHSPAVLVTVTQEGPKQRAVPFQWSFPTVWK